MSWNMEGGWSLNFDSGNKVDHGSSERSEWSNQRTGNTTYRNTMTNCENNWVIINMAFKKSILGHDFFWPIFIF